MLVITDEDMEKDTKIQMLLSFDNLTSFSQKKLKLPKFSQSAELVDRLGPESWILFYQKHTEGRVRNANIRLQHYIM